MTCLVIDQGQFNLVLNELKEGQPMPSSFFEFADSLQKCLELTPPSPLGQTVVDLLEKVVYRKERFLRTERFLCLWTNNLASKFATFKNKAGKDLNLTPPIIEDVVTSATKAEFLDALAVTLESLLQFQKFDFNLGMLLLIMGKVYSSMLKETSASLPLNWKEHCCSCLISSCKLTIQFYGFTAHSLTPEKATVLVSLLKFYNSTFANVPSKILQSSQHREFINTIFKLLVNDVIQQHYPDPELLCTSFSTLCSIGHLSPHNFIDSFREFKHVFEQEPKLTDSNSMTEWFNNGEWMELKLGVLGDVMKFLGFVGIFENESFLKDILNNGLASAYIPAKNNAVYAIGQMFRYGENIDNSIRVEFLHKLLDLLKNNKEQHTDEERFLENTIVGSLSRILAHKPNGDDRIFETVTVMICDRVPLLSDPKENVSVLRFFLATLINDGAVLGVKKSLLAKILDACSKISICSALQNDSEIQKGLLMVGCLARVAYPTEMLSMAEKKIDISHRPQPLVMSQ